MAEPEEKKTIEENLASIEEVTARLESGTLTLSEALEEFKKGVALVKAASEQLGEAEKTLKLLTEDGELHDF